MKYKMEHVSHKREKLSKTKCTEVFCGKFDHPMISTISLTWNEWNPFNWKIDISEQIILLFKSQRQSRNNKSILRICRCQMRGSTKERFSFVLRIHNIRFNLIWLYFFPCFAPGYNSCMNIMNTKTDTKYTTFTVHSETNFGRPWFACISFWTHCEGKVLRLPPRWTISEIV